MIEPPDLLLIFDIRDINNIKFVGRIPLDTYGIGIFTKERMFFSSWVDSKKGLMYTYQKLINIIELPEKEIYYLLIKVINKNEECKPYIIEFEKRYHFFRWYTSYELINNDIVIYTGKKVDIYTINLK